MIDISALSSDDVCPVIKAFMVSWNGGLLDEDRAALLLPLMPKIVGTRGSTALQHRRSAMATNWLVQVNASAWLRLPGLESHADGLAEIADWAERADVLSSMPDIADFAKEPALLPFLEATKESLVASTFSDAASAALTASASDAAWDAASVATADAWDATKAAWDIAKAALSDDTSNAARAAERLAKSAAAADHVAAMAWDIAAVAASTYSPDDLAETVNQLQASAVLLVERICALTEE
ncbi:hypothetical protein [Mesorhizobium sp.]|uniref:hypothetical protein n=1 Tax=Mesorhizobium sp. TaxID=1871066 RepID=UPI000FE7BCA0|nr:hypothetical protein [Mesorhizobium sp.]RWP31829.1 MAG: hypothetical protein EOR02_08425 [Mesorhizobium sp.]